MATWPSGKAGACKALITGSNPVVASRSFSALRALFISRVNAEPSCQENEGSNKSSCQGRVTLSTNRHGCQERSRCDTTGSQDPRFLGTHWQECHKTACPDPISSQGTRFLGTRAMPHIKTSRETPARIISWWPYQDSNLEPVDYESIALTVAP